MVCPLYQIRCLMTELYATTHSRDSQHLFCDNGSLLLCEPSKFVLSPAELGFPRSLLYLSQSSFKILQI